MSVSPADASWTDAGNVRLYVAGASVADMTPGVARSLAMALLRSAEGADPTSSFRLLCGSTYQDPIGGWGACDRFAFHDGDHDCRNYSWSTSNEFRVAEDDR